MPPDPDRKPTPSDQDPAFFAAQVAAHIKAEIVSVFEERLAAPAEPRPFLSIKDITALLNVSRKTAEKVVRDSTFPRPIMVRSQRRWSPEAVEAYLRRLGRGGFSRG